MNRLTLECYQVWAYLIAIGLGLAVGTAWPGIGPAMETMLWPTFAALLFVTFVQAPCCMCGMHCATGASQGPCC